MCLWIKGRLHEQKMKEANHAAAVQIFEKVNASLLPMNVLDLHGLHVDEAMNHLSRVLQEKSEGRNNLIISSPHTIIFWHTTQQGQSRRNTLHMQENIGGLSIANLPSVVTPANNLFFL